MSIGKSVVFMVIIAALLGCTRSASDSTSNGKVLGTLKEVGRISLKKAGIFKSIVVKEDVVYAYDISSKSLVIYEKDKEPIYYSKIGKGPGEWKENSFEVFAIDGATIYAFDTFLQKIMLFKFDKLARSIHFIDEFMVNDGRLTNAVLQPDGKILVSLIAGKNQFITYYPDGRVDTQYLPVTKEVEAFSEEGILAIMDRMFIVGKALLTVNFTTYDIQVYDYNNTALIPSSPIELQHIFYKKPWKIKTSGDTFHVSLDFGIAGFAYCKNMYLFVVCDKKESISTFFQAYDEKGKYIGNYSVEAGKGVYRYLGYDENGKVYYQPAKKGLLKNIFQKTDEIVIGEFVTSTVQ